MQDFLSDKSSLAPFLSGCYNDSLAQLCAKDRAAGYSLEQRKVLVDSLWKQYNQVDVSKQTEQHINQLLQANTVTVTTGHQLNLFTGPMFFWYKILDVINKAAALQRADKSHHYVPVFWMASEDHDFEEINHFYLGEQKLRWDAQSGGPVGRMPTAQLESLLAPLKAHWGNTPLGAELCTLFSECYLQEKTLVKATRTLVNRLFGSYGLVIIDGDDRALKSLFVPVIKKELTQQTTWNSVNNTTERLKKAYAKYIPQVNPRELNVFYMLDNKRIRIIQDAKKYATSDGEQHWETEQLLNEVDQYPERFSPNALMRPLYQEVVLPNITYIGGGGELAYWIQLKETFKEFNIPFPLLKHRCTALLVTNKQFKKFKNLNLPLEDLFLPASSLINKRVRYISDIDIDFSKQREALQNQFADLFTLAQQTDASFLGAVEAQQKKQLKGLDTLEKRLLKAQRIKLQDHIVRITDLRHELFPNGKHQERIAHFSSFVGEEGVVVFTKNLKEALTNAPEGLSILSC